MVGIRESQKTRKTRNKIIWTRQMQAEYCPGRYRLTWKDANDITHENVVRVSENSTPLLLK